MLVAALRAVFYLTLPATVGLILLSVPIVEMFFMRGAFDSQDVAMVSWALAWFAVGLVAHSELEIVTRAFYALHDTATPVWVGGGAMALNVVLSLLLMRLFEQVGLIYLPGVYEPWMPLGGLCLANSLATMLETLILAWLLHRRLGGLGSRVLWMSLLRTALSALAMGGALWIYLGLVPTRNAWILGCGGILVGGGTFLVASLLLRSPEPKEALAAVRRRRQ
jgi:putative peptidoglycan lipid II flippase